MKQDLPAALVRIVTDSQVPLTVSDPNLTDDPIVLANAAFCRITGYQPNEIIGRNCRILQGNSVQSARREELRKSLDGQSDARTILRNFRKNGDAFDNLICVHHLTAENGRLIFRLGAQFEIPATRKAVALAAHSDGLRIVIEALRANVTVPGGGRIRINESAGVSIRDLLQLRLSTLRAHRSL
jgi:PAS domain S-box-containing protein